MADGGEQPIFTGHDCERRGFGDEETGRDQLGNQENGGDYGDQQEDNLIAWLRDAHAMEAATTDNLERLIGRADKYPQLKTPMQHHLEISRRQKEELEEQLKALGSDTSTLKDMAMRAPGVWNRCCRA